MTKRYEVTGIPISPPFAELEGRKVGDVFDAQIDADIEDLLVGGGALRVLPRPQRDKQEKPRSKEEPSWPGESPAQSARAAESSAQGPRTSRATRAKDPGR